MLLPTVLLAFCLLGFVFAAHRYLRLPWSFAPFFCVILLGVSQYLFAIAEVLAAGTWFIIALGWGLFIILVLQAFHRQSLGDYFRACPQTILRLQMRLMGGILRLNSLNRTRYCPHSSVKYHSIKHIFASKNGSMLNRVGNQISIYRIKSKSC